MKRRQQRNRPWIAILLLLVIIFLARSVWGVWQKSELAREAKKQAVGEMASLETRRDALEARVSALETPRGEEAEFRNNFPVVKEGEKMIVIVDEEATASATTSESWFQKLFKF